MVKDLIQVLVTILGVLSFQPDTQPMAMSPDLAPATYETDERHDAQPAIVASQQQPEPAEPVAVSPGIPQPIDRQLRFARMHLPAGFGPNADGHCDVVLHFHGAYATVVPPFDASGLRAALLVVNLGDSSSAYSDKYADRNALERALVATQAGLDAALPEAQRCVVGRVALSAWSAGGGAISRILRHRQGVERVDAVLIGDGLHAQYANPLARVIEPIGMSAIVSFARSAAAGDKLLTITHSAVETYGYASTTRAASFLLAQLGIDPVVAPAAAPRNMTMSYRAEQRGLHVRGYEGTDGAAHCDHLRAIDGLLLADLQARWASP